MRRGALRAAAFSLALVALASACTSKPRPARSTSPVAGGTLHVAVRDLSTLDPAKASGRGAMLVLSQVFRPLTAINPAGDAIPAAASSWTVTADGKRWDFHLAKATFQNGQPVTATAFVEAFDRIAVRSTGSDAAYQLEAVRGFRGAKVTGTAKRLVGVTTRGRDTSTVVIFLDHPFAELPRFLAHPALVPLLHKDIAKGKLFSDAPIGNGPFKVATERTASGVTLERFDGYTGKKAYLDKIDVVVRSDAESIWSDLKGGKLDVGEVPATHSTEAIKSFGSAGFTPFSAAFYYGFNMRLSKYGKAETRRAISLAIDRAALVKDVYGGTKDAATGIVPTGVAGARAAPCDSCAFDLPQARSLLNKVFKGRPPPVTIDHLDAQPSRDLARAVAAQLRDAGLRVSLRAHSSADYKKLLASGKQDVAELGWFSDVPSPDPFLAQQLRTGSPNNPSHFSDRTFDAAVDKARSQRDPSKRIALYKAAQDRALTLMPLVPLVFFRSRMAARPVVHGFRLDGAGLFDASAIWIA